MPHPNFPAVSALGLTFQSLGNWKRVPAGRVEVTAAALGLDPDLLRRPAPKPDAPHVSAA